MRKFLALSEQDQSLLLHLHRHIYLSRDFIDRYIYNSDEEGKTTTAHEKSVYRRLKQLKDAEYITSFAVPTSPGTGRPSNIYTLDEFGVEMVEQMTGIKHWNYRWSKEPQIWYMHTLTLAEVVKSFEKNAPPGVVVKEFVSEGKSHFKYYDPSTNNNNKPQSHYIRPDGILVIGKEEHDEGNIALMLEMERSYADRSGTMRKLKQYNHFFSGRVVTNEGKEEFSEAYKKRMKQFDEKVALESPVEFEQWNILFIGDSESMGKRILRQLKGQETKVPLLAAAKDDLLKDPYGKIYRDLYEPEILTKL
ncbi:DNA-binding PadR family transcriptional regulator [Priestia megaterium]|uniref:replication-relaxation family protein n=1 Tax=Priestia megaterium TaxID=1404 RepID=UPI00339AF028